MKNLEIELSRFETIVKCTLSEDKQIGVKKKKIGSKFYIGPGCVRSNYIRKSTGSENALRIIHLWVLLPNTLSHRAHNLFVT